MIPKPFNDVKKEDLEALVSNSVFEGKTIEFKRELPSQWGPDEKREFLKDVSSFANTGGGDLLFGVTAEQGQAIDVPGLAGLNFDAEQLRMLQIIQNNGVSPRLPNLQFQKIDGFPQGPVLHIRIPQSWLKPHAVTFGGGGIMRFYSRTGAGAQPLDIGEVREAFLSAEALPERMKRFRLERVAKALAHDGPIEIDPGPMLILHLIPVSPAVVDVSLLPNRWTEFYPLYDGDTHSRLNFDGYLTYTYLKNSPTWSYLQIFQNDTFEAVDVANLSTDKGFISNTIEQPIVKAVANYLSKTPSLGINPPLYLMLTVTGAKGLGIQSRGYSRFSGQKIDREVLLLDAAIIENVAVPAATILRPVFDALWRSAGYPRSQNYDDDGTWRLKI